MGDGSRYILFLFYYEVKIINLRVSPIASNARVLSSIFFGHFEMADLRRRMYLDCKMICTSAGYVVGVYIS